MIHPASLAFDIDGVVANTMQLFLDIARADYGVTHVTYDDITSYDLEDCLALEASLIEAIIVRLLNGDYKCTLAPLEGAPQVLSQLAQWHSPLLFVTARPYHGPIAAWLHALLNLPPADVQIVATGSFDAKAEVLIGRDIQFFVEDRLETCFGLAAAGITPIVFKQPWNRVQHPFQEVGSWRELESLIDYDPQSA